MSLELCEKALNFTKQIRPIADSDLRIMIHSSKTILFHGNEPFTKRKGNGNFGAPVGCFHEAEVCELVGTYMLSQINTVFENKNVSLYRDHELGIFRYFSGPETEKKRKATVCIFKK